jgi:hypothetical protein
LGAIVGRGWNVGGVGRVRGGVGGTFTGGGSVDRGGRGCGPFIGGDIVGRGLNGRSVSSNCGGRVGRVCGTGLKGGGVLTGPIVGLLVGCLIGGRVGRVTTGLGLKVGLGGTLTGGAIVGRGRSGRSVKFSSSISGRSVGRGTGRGLVGGGPFTGGDIGGWVGNGREGRGVTGTLIGGAKVGLVFVGIGGAFVGRGTGLETGGSPLIGGDIGGLGLNEGSVTSSSTSCGTLIGGGRGLKEGDGGTGGCPLIGGENVVLGL